MITKHLNNQKYIYIDMGTLTVNVDAGTEDRFREQVARVYGRRKGALGKALTEAMESWVAQNTSVHRCMELLEKGVHLGGLTYKKRDELHDRH